MKAKGVEFQFRLITQFGLPASVVSNRDVEKRWGGKSRKKKPVRLINTPNRILKSFALTLWFPATGSGGGEFRQGKGGGWGSCNERVYRAKVLAPGLCVREKVIMGGIQKRKASDQGDTDQLF